MPHSVADKAFAAWQTGEQTGNYAAMRALLGPQFVAFSHPLRGRFTGPEALAQLQQLIGERERTPNALTFANVHTTESPEQVAYHFDSAGTVSGQFPYQGHNIIVFSIADEQLTGMAEYFGFVDPAWFR